ncbi:hypothetical protein E0H86_13275 [Acinetobacter sp. ANC 4635]|uniref:P-loop NTPase fold protein n=1 Tax=Acinetobacter sp. ANC 4635 TaxID=2529846 RepID=UPI00103F92AB|nr:P-loop NTPase fold protein [Acinetobacter sp. ANC 4635]TCB26563.1 hypothetical protein E0H86_13275 [Acinetobacter sp. ANC 4635]
MNSQEYISEPNKHIEEYLDYYFSGSKKLEYAVLLNGEWGSGKTWFVKKYIEKQKKQGKKVSYISLNGLSKTADIDDAIFKSIHPVLASKQAKLAGQVLKGALKATLKIDLDEDSKDDGSVGISVPDIKLPDYLKINDKFILVFDDLERCELKIEETLGYINYFVEQENIKVLIVSNDTEIKESDHFLRKKEKLIGATFNYTEDQELAIRSILEEISSSDLKDKLISKILFITEIFNKIAYKNLRAFKQTIFDFERFYRKDIFEWKGDFDQDIFEKLLKSFLILSIENKKGRFDKEILRFKKDEYEGKNAKDNSEKVILKIMCGINSRDSEDFMNKYNLGLNEFIISPNLWNEILNLNIIDKSKIEEELYEVYFRFKEEQPTWLKLMNFLDLDECEFDELVELAKEEVENHQLENPSDILHTISILIYLKENQLISFSLDHLLPIAIADWKKFIEVNEKMRRIYDHSFVEYSGHYGFIAKEIPQFSDFMKDIVKAYEDKYSEKDATRASELIDLMENNSQLFIQRISLTNREENYYYNYPIMKEVNAQVFANKLCMIKQSDCMSSLYGLSHRYSIQASFNMYIEEKSWFNQVEDYIKTNILPTANKITKARINLRILPEISKIKEDAEK